VSTIEITRNFSAKNTSKTDLFLAGYIPKASTPICCLFSDHKTLADAILFLKQFDEIFGLTLYPGYCSSDKLHKAKCLDIRRTSWSEYMEIFPL